MFAFFFSFFILIDYLSKKTQIDVEGEKTTICAVTLFEVLHFNIGLGIDDDK